MKFKLALVAALALTACQTTETPKNQDVQTVTAQAEKFSCRNGLTVSVRMLAEDRIELMLDDKRAQLNEARSGSGALYTASTGLFGSGAQWHQKGQSAFFSFKDPYGNQVETTCNAM